MNKVGSILSRGFEAGRIVSPCSVRWEFGAGPRVVDVRGCEDFERAKEVMGRLLESDRPGDIVVKYEKKDVLQVTKFVGELIRRQNEFKHPIEMLSYGEVEVLKPLSEKVLEDFKGLPEAIKPKALWALKVLGRLFAAEVCFFGMFFSLFCMEEAQRLCRTIINPISLCAFVSCLGSAHALVHLIYDPIEKFFGRFFSNIFLFKFTFTLIGSFVIGLHSMYIQDKHSYIYLLNWVPMEVRDFICDVCDE